MNYSKPWRKPQPVPPIETGTFTLDGGATVEVDVDTPTMSCLAFLRVHQHFALSSGLACVGIGDLRQLALFCSELADQLQEAEGDN